MLLSVYKHYFAAIGYWICLIVMFSYIISTGLGIGSSLWLAAWSASTASVETLANSTSLDTRLGVYLILGMGQGELKSESRRCFFEKIFYRRVCVLGYNFYVLCNSSG